MTIITIASIASWVICGVAAYGLVLGYFQRKYNCYGFAEYYRKSDLELAWMCAALGPIGLLMQIILNGTTYGFLWKPLTEHEINYGRRRD